MFIKFVGFSISAGIIQLISFTILNEFAGLDFWIAYVIAIVLSVIYNFTVNRRFTFRSVNNIPVAMALALAFYVAFTPYSTVLGDYLTDGALLGTGLFWNETLVVIFLMLQNMVLEFIWWRFFIFRKSINTRPDAPHHAE